MTKKKATKRAPRATKAAPKTIRQGDKAKFIRGLPRTLPALEVQARAAREGMQMSLPYIHNIRSASLQKSREILKTSGRKPIKGTRKQKEALFKDLVILLGAPRAQVLLAQAELAMKLDTAQ